MSKKIDYQKLEKKLTTKKQSCFEIWDENVTKKAFDFAETYIEFLNKAKTEREVIKESVKLAKRNGFKDLSEVKSIKVGDQVYAINRNKNLILARIGKKGMNDGFRAIMAHVDAPHLDFKTSPLYEDESLAFLKTHYYGGIKKYQWPTIPLSLHGVAFLKDGKSKEFIIGEDEADPIFMITDLLPHLDRGGGPGSQIKNREVLGEDLNLLVGSVPIKDDKVKEKVKLAVLAFLYDKYGIVEEDLFSTELQAVPSGKARDLGFDRSMIAAYGHDDRICAYAGLQSFFSSKLSDRTQVMMLVDREEIGSDGNTSIRSMFIEQFVTDLLKKSGKVGDFGSVCRLFSESQVISADVTAAVDPDYKDVHDLRNACRLGYGAALEKYVGSGGKYSTSEASAEFVASLREIFSKEKDLQYQVSGGLGKVDLGGGGTIAKYLANRNMDVVDMGIPLFNMHAPYEIASKADLYCAYLAYKIFLSN